GRITRQLMDATVALPKDAPGIVVEDVPMNHRLYQMAGGYYELAAMLFRPPGAARVVRLAALLPPVAQSSNLLFYRYREGAPFEPLSQQETVVANELVRENLASAARAQTGIVAAVAPHELRLHVGTSGAALASVINAGPSMAFDCAITSP